MKRFKFIFIMLLLTSCSKMEDENKIVSDECVGLSYIQPFLIGKWQLNTRQCLHTNSTNCFGYGSNWYPVAIFPSNDMIEILANGKINIFKNNEKVSSFLATDWVSNNSQSGILVVNCGKNLFMFRNYEDSLSSVDIGSRIHITNQYIDLNFENYPGISKCYEQQFIKIE